MPKLDERLSNTYNHVLTSITPSQIRSFSKEISNVPDLISLNVGEPGFNTPEHVKDAAIKSIAENKSHYSPQNGWKELREVISNFLSQRYGINYDAETEITVTDGAAEALSSTFLATVNPGDKVLVPMPAYPAYTSVIEMAGGVVVPVDTSDDQFKLTSEKLTQVLDENPDISEIILNYPNNPTGVEYTDEELKALAKILRDRGILVIADEIYSELTYELNHTSIAEFIPNSTIVINGVSKSHAMTGYRLGYVAGPAEAVTNVNKVHGYLVTSPSNPAQYGAVEALENGVDDTKPMLKEYRKRRDLVTKELRKLGFKVTSPDGAFYIFAKIPDKYNENSREFALRLAKEAHVGVTPGSAFGKSGEDYLRLSYAADMDQIEEAMKRINQFVNEKA
ncbi:aromatic amino acid aminotransferase [Fructilactobacillus lindneri]|uniref:Aminotransferase n=2 Tax=Fructilactobacillus lindneri TaxID=53444 RepID=A0A0R2K0S5_9LACO|nr:aminotransferase class I/II-fold pyridoxal phosphate-dependent enzyme [Fructilactobacillus lindneri]ANZ58064.1 aromatic amino acid aminotransferase [Fructilactobacillus lindneri]ANZ59385.1 aromatic amino acid aminotransferase [Fructilactobacillus lindneri]KRN80684.1 aminotransferase A [Fructilactobacillus lindneri DSM 20690 = JCM 11027]POG98831.1 aromatic amino acid aminotransferase [Fructilactobacillus lindneri]POH03104.1 aromatic amino acid aminotransferase [Fructilactobacillus lindneri]